MGLKDKAQDAMDNVDNQEDDSMMDDTRMGDSSMTEEADDKL